MSIHFACGIYLMIMCITQLIIISSKCSRNNKIIKIHFLIGITLFIASVLISISGILYALIYSTIGGVFMTCSFTIYGFLIFIITIISSFISFKLKKNREYEQYLLVITTQDNDDYNYNYNYSNYSNCSNCSNCSICFKIINYFKTMKFDTFKKFHSIINDIYCSLVYGSLLYRIFYVYAAWCGYTIPFNNKNLTELYTRPLDRIFQVSFYVLPIVIIIIYNKIYYTKNKCLILFIQILFFAISLLSAVLMTIGFIL